MTMSERGQRDIMFWDVTRRFFDQGDPVAPLHAVIRSADSGEPLPKWVVEYLAARFRKYLAPTETRSLEKILGLAPLGPGQSSAIKEQLHREWEFECVATMWKLHKVMGLTVVDASKQVERWALRNPRRRSLGLEIFSAGTLRDKYYRRFKRELDQFPAQYEDAGISWDETKEAFRVWLEKEFGIEPM